MRRFRWHRIINGVVFWTLTYPFGVLIGIMFYALRLFGILRVEKLERFPYLQKKLIVVSNHPSLWEPILLVGLFFKQFVFHPVRFSPWSTPDKGNYFDKWYWFFVRPRFIPVPRGKVRAEMRSLIKIIRVLRNGGSVIFFPEGGRTHKGVEFFHSRNGKRIRKLRTGVGDIIAKTGATVVPIWVDGTENVLPNNGAMFPRLWKRHSIKVGKPIIYNGTKLDRKKITAQIVKALIQLAEEE